MTKPLQCKTILPGSWWTGSTVKLRHWYFMNQTCYRHQNMVGTLVRKEGLTLGTILSNGTKGKLGNLG